MKKSVLILGASGGIGEAIAKEFANSGYDIYATYNKGGLDQLEQYCKSKNVEITKICMDIENQESITNAFKIVFQAEYLESVINATGLSLSETLLCDERVENIDKLIDTNLKGAILISREAMKYFINLKRGCIINISSIYGIYGGSCEAVYSATKGGIIAFTKALAQECAGFNVRVNCVAPGCIETKMTERYLSTEQGRQELINSTPLKRIGMPEDVAKAVKFLATDQSSFITGECLTVSGGVLTF